MVFSNGVDVDTVFRFLSPFSVFSFLNFPSFIVCMYTHIKQTHRQVLLYISAPSYLLHLLMHLPRACTSGDSLLTSPLMTNRHLKPNVYQIQLLTSRHQHSCSFLRLFLLSQCTCVPEWMKVRAILLSWAFIFQNTAFSSSAVLSAFLLK